MLARPFINLALISMKVSTNKYTVVAEFSDLRFNDQKTQALERPKCKKHPGYSDLKCVDKNWPLNQAGTMYTKSSVLRTQF